MCYLHSMFLLYKSNKTISTVLLEGKVISMFTLFDMLDCNSHCHLYIYTILSMHSYSFSQQLTLYAKRYP